MKRSAKTQDQLVKKEKFIRNGFPVLNPMNDSQSKFLEALKYSTLIVGSGSAGTGKAQPLTSKILTPNGWKLMKDIVVGDTVRGRTKWVEVLGVFPQGKKQIVELILKDGGKTQCCLDHLWTVNDSVGKNSSTLKTIDTKELISKIDLKKQNPKYRNISIPLLEKIESPYRDYSIHPYILGALIGDGGLTHRPCITSADNEILSRFKKHLHKNYKLSKVGNTITYNIVKKINETKNNYYKEELIKLGLFGTTSQFKFIPDEYKNGSLEQKYDLLKGLFDTDGTVDHRSGAVSYCTTSELLAEDIKNLIFSIGGKASISTSQKYYSYKNERKKGLLAYIIHVNLLDKKELFSLSRKRDLVSNNDCKQMVRQFVDYKYKGEVECQCILVDSEDHLYVTDDYILTHNTLLSIWHAAKRLYYGDIKKIVLIRAYQPLAGRSIGFLPGTLDEKLTPFYQQMLDYLEDYLGKASTEIHLKNKTIEICSLETIRGRSWDRSIIIIDEAQNLFVPEVQALVTRIGKDSQMIFCGDDSGTQTDIKNTMNGLSYLDALVNKYYISDTAFIRFNREDIVRSGITKEFVIAFEQELQESINQNSITDIYNKEQSNNQKYRK